MAFGLPRFCLLSKSRLSPRGDFQRRGERKALLGVNEAGVGDGEASGAAVEAGRMAAWKLSGRHRSPFHSGPTAGLLPT